MEVAYVNEATRQFHEIIMMRARNALSLPVRTVDVWDIECPSEAIAEVAADLTTSDGSRWELSVEWVICDPDTNELRILNWLLQRMKR